MASGGEARWPGGMRRCATRKWLIPAAVASSEAKPKSSGEPGGAAGASISRQFLMNEGLAGRFILVASGKGRGPRFRQSLEASTSSAYAAAAARLRANALPPDAQYR